MGPDFHDGQKTTKKNFPLKWQTKTKKNSNLAWTHKKLQKIGVTNTLSQKKFSTKVAKKIKKNSKKGFLKTA